MKKEDAKHSGESSLQNIFTAYLLQAVRHKRQDYIKRQIRYQQTEYLQEEVQMDKAIDFSEEFERVLPLEMQLENTALLLARNILNERERNILLAHVLNEEGFDTLATKYDVSYKAMSERYYRTIRKLKKRMGGK